MPKWARLDITDTTITLPMTSSHRFPSRIKVHNPKHHFQTVDEYNRPGGLKKGGSYNLPFKNVRRNRSLPSLSNNNDSELEAEDQHIPLQFVFFHLPNFVLQGFYLLFQTRDFLLRVLLLRLSKLDEELKA